MIHVKPVIIITIGTLIQIALKEQYLRDLVSYYLFMMKKTVANFSLRHVFDGFR